MIDNADLMKRTNFDESITLGELANKLVLGEAIKVTLPNGYTRYVNCYSRLDKIDAALQIVKPFRYDWLSKTYYVKIAKYNKMGLRSDSYYGVDPMTNNYDGYDGLKIKRVICNGPATIVFWNDGTKTVVKCEKEPEEDDFEKGILYAALKKLATKKEYDNILRAIDKIESEAKK